jgi:hypothetical protein
MERIEVTISNLRYQIELLSKLTSMLEKKTHFDDDDHAIYDQISKEVEKNLKKIRKEIN